MNYKFGLSRVKDILKFSCWWRNSYDKLPAKKATCAEKTPDLKDFVNKKLVTEREKGKGIAPKIYGRICNALRKRPCLAKVS